MWAPVFLPVLAPGTEQAKCKKTQIAGFFTARKTLALNCTKTRQDSPDFSTQACSVTCVEQLRKKPGSIWCTNKKVTAFFARRGSVLFTAGEVRKQILVTVSKESAGPLQPRHAALSTGKPFFSLKMKFFHVFQSFLKIRIVIPWSEIEWGFHV